MKVCSTCLQEKADSDFHRRGDSLKSACKACRKIDPVAKAWRQRPERAEYQKQWVKTPKGRAYQRRKNARRDYSKMSLRTRLALGLRVRLNAALRAGTKSGSAVRDLGCTIQELRTHLETLFKPGMTWDNWGRGPSTWQIDHIRPLAGFDLTQREQLLQACHYTNLQPLWHQDHVVKTAKEYCRAA